MLRRRSTRRSRRNTPDCPLTISSPSWLTTKGVQRVQVKSSARPDAKGHWGVEIGRRPYVLDKSASKMPYDPDDIDLFFIVLGDGSVYVIPSSVLAGRIRIYAETYAPYRVGDASGLLR